MPVGRIPAAEAAGPPSASCRRGVVRPALRRRPPRRSYAYMACVGVHGVDSRREGGGPGPGPLQDAPRAGHDGGSGVPVDTALRHGALAQDPPDRTAGSGTGRPEQLLVAGGEVVLLVAADHPERPAHLGVAAEVLDQHARPAGGPLLGHPAVREVDEDLVLGQRLVAAQRAVGEAEPSRAPGKGFGTRAPLTPPCRHPQGASQFRYGTAGDSCARQHGRKDEPPGGADA